MDHPWCPSHLTWAQLSRLTEKTACLCRNAYNCKQSPAVAIMAPLSQGTPAFPPHAVLGRFLHSLNRFCLDQYGMEYDVGDYEEYNFAKVGSEDKHALYRCICWAYAPCMPRSLTWSRSMQI